MHALPPLPNAPWTLDTTSPLPTLQARHLKALLHRAVEPVPGLPAPLQRPFASAQAQIAAVARQAPGAVLGALALPVVSAPLLAAPMVGAAKALSDALPTLLLELARQRRLPPEGHWWGLPLPRLLSPPLGLAWEATVPVVGALFRNGEVDLGEAGVISLVAPPQARRYWPLRAGGWLCGADNNPLAMLEAHPEKEGNTLSFGDTSPEEWVARIDDARQTLADTLPALAAEHARLLAQVVPVGTHAERSFSASYREAIGVVYVSLHPEGLTMTEALIHETQHNKLNLLSLVEPLLSNPPDACYPSPVRPDPRPIWGVLLAVHAFLPVAALYRALHAHTPLRPHDQERWAAVRRLNWEGMETLRAHAQPVGAGGALLAGMDALERALRDA